MHPVMKTQLSNLRIDSVDLCQRGANQYADIKLYKSINEKGGERQVKKNWLQRVSDRIYKSEAEKMDSYVTPSEQIEFITKALGESFESIADADISDAEKNVALVKSVGECMDFIAKASETWFDTDDEYEPDEEVEKDDEEVEEEPTQDNEETVFAENEEHGAVEEAEDEVETDATADKTEESEIEETQEISEESQEVDSEQVEPIIDEPAVQEEEQDDETMEKSDFRVYGASKRTDTVFVGGSKESFEDNKEEDDFMKFADFDVEAMPEQDLAELKRLAKLYCSNCDDVAKSVSYDESIIAKAMEDMEEIRKANAALQEELELRDMRDIAKSYECTGQDVNELAMTLHEMKKSSTKAYEDHIQLLDQMKANYEGGIFKTYGSDNAYTIEEAFSLEDMVDNICKSYPGISRADAIVRAYQENPGLPEYK